jgi:hypothetical protein
MPFQAFHSLSYCSSSSTLTFPFFTKPSGSLSRSDIVTGNGKVVSGDAAENVEVPAE